MEAASGSTATAPAIRQLYFLVGAQRSGSTMLRLMLDHHPQVACLHEFNFALLAADADGGHPDLATLHERLQADRQWRYAGLELDPALDYPAQLDAFLERWRQRDGGGKPVVGVTIHFRYDLALALWPEARFIHLVRDPRDVAPSVIKMGWAGNTWHATDRWVEAEREVDALAAALPPDRLLRVRFEDLVHDPEGELGRLCTLLGVDYDPAMLDYPADTSYPAPDPSAAYRWRGKAPELDVQLVEARAGALLADRGYEASGHPDLALSGIGQFRLGVQDRLARLRFRMRRYGAGAVLTNAVATRLGLDDTSARMRQRMQDQDQRNLR
ncbi:MAG: sulfotransferase family protein [Planctomycetota bacterium]|jgi:hypothetical protein